MTNTTKFTSLREVTATIEALGLAVTPAALAAIQKNGKEPFLQHLSCCAANDDQEGKHKKYLEALFKCLDTQALALLQDTIPDITVDDVATAATNAPVRLLSTINIAVDPENERRDSAIGWLKELAGCAGKKQNEAAAPEPAAPVMPAPRDVTQPAASQSTEPRQQPASSPAQGEAPVDNAQKFQSHHVYGSNFALCFNATDWKGEFGIMVDAATANGPKSYDWKKAIHIWLSPVEVAAIVAVFRRWRKSVEFSAHGNQNDKSFAIEYQSSHFFAKVSAKVDAGKTRAVKIMPADATAVSILFLRQLGEAYKGIPLTEILATVRATHQMENAA